MSDVDVSLEMEFEGGCVVKLQTPTWELNIRGSAAELTRLGAIRQSAWDARETLAVGESAGSRVFWSSDGQMATISIGDDDETWDLAFTVPVGVVDELVRAAADHA
jgi:hypothetical protein